jgi:hypothetical protein
MPWELSEIITKESLHFAFACLGWLVLYRILIILSRGTEHGTLRLPLWVWSCLALGSGILSHTLADIFNLGF